MAAANRLFNLEARCAVVTGAGSGIGEATAALLAQAGARVILADRNGESAEKAAAAIGASGGQAEASDVDVTDEVAVERMFESAVSTHGGIDILVNNAGLAIRKPATELPAEDWQRVVDVNMTAVFLCARPPPAV